MEKGKFELFPDGKRRRVLYDDGLPFSRKVKENLDDLRQRILNRKASLLIIDGGVGEGKTTLAVHCAEQFQGEPINFKKQLAYGGEEFQEKLVICIDSKLKVIIYDEAGDFSKRGSLTNFNQQLNRVFETYRTYGILVILVLPCFRILDSQLLENKIPRLLLNCHSRGQSQGEIRGYSLFSMYWLLHYFAKLTVKPQAYSRVYPNFRGHFLNLSPKRTAELDAYSTSNKREVLTENILRNRGLKSILQIAQDLQRSRDYILKIIRLLGIKEDYKKGATRYYAPDKVGRIKRKLKI